MTVLEKLNLYDCHLHYRPQESVMKNPWLKKNPFMSMWLSGANTMLGSARAQATAQAKRQTAAMMTEGANQMIRFWSGAPGAPTTRKKRKSR